MPEKSFFERVIRENQEITRYSIKDNGVDYTCSFVLPKGWHTVFTETIDNGVMLTKDLNQDLENGIAFFSDTEYKWVEIK